MKLFIIGLILIAILALIWNIQANKNPYVQHSNYPYLWFAAVKHSNTSSEGFRAADGVEISWRAKGELAFIGSQSLEPYWDTLLLLGSEQEVAAPVKFSNDIEDAYLVRLQAYQAPPLALSLFSILHRVGIWSKPPNPATNDVDIELIRADIGPSQESVDALFEQPSNRKPMMVNFVKFYDNAQYLDGDIEKQREVSGRIAYDRYGDIANKTVYSVGGEYVLGGYIKEVLREAKNGLTVGDWDDIAVMQYPDPTAILTMGQVAEYRNALFHRNAGLENTVIIFSHN